MFCVNRCLQSAWWTCFALQRRWRKPFDSILFCPISRACNNPFSSCPVFSCPSWAGKVHSCPLFNYFLPPLLLSAILFFFFSLCHVGLSLLNQNTLRHGQTTVLFLSWPEFSVLLGLNTFFHYNEIPHTQFKSEKVEKEWDLTFLEKSGVRSYFLKIESWQVWYSEKFTRKIHWQFFTARFLFRILYISCRNTATPQDFLPHPHPPKHTPLAVDEWLLTLIISDQTIQIQESVTENSAFIAALVY